MHGRFSVSVIAVVVLAGCSVSPAVSVGPGATQSSPATLSATQPTGPVVSPRSTTVVTTVQFAETADPTAAAAREIDLVRQARDDAGMTALIGPNGADAFAELDAIVDEYAASLISEIDAAIDADTIPQGLVRGPGETLASLGALFQFDASLFADTGFTASAIMTLYSQIIQQAAQTQSGTLPRQEHVDRVEGRLRHQVDLNTTFTIQTGGGRVNADLIMSATDRMSDPQSGSFVALYTSRTVGHFDVSACPDEGGVAEGTYTFETTHELNDVSSRDAARSAAGRSVDAPFRLIDGEDAHLIEIEAALNMEAEAFGPGSPSGPGPTSPFDWGATQQAQIVMPVSGSTTATGTGIAVTGIGGEQAGGAMFISSAMAQLFLAQVGKEAERFWRSGECIVINTTQESRNVGTGETVEFEAEAEGRFDHLEIDAPIRAEFSGEQSLDPAGTPVDPPARFTFVAGPETGDKGTIQLEQVGVRGIGKKRVEFTVAGGSYEGILSGVRLGGSLHYTCGQRDPYWALDYGAPYGFVAYDIPPGSTDPVPAEIVNGDPRWTPLMQGTGQFVPGDPPHFIIVNGEGTFDVVLNEVDCPPPPSP